MRFGIREVCDVALNKINGEGPTSVLLDTAKMTTLEGASTTVYAQGGKGNSRLMAWEGEKTLTFTVEDALITPESFHALTGTVVEKKENSIKFVSKTTSFAGYYKITASTLIRNEEGADCPAVITIPKAKLQTQLNLSMAPTGDPSTFTFTFDAFPNENNELFIIEIAGMEYATSDTVTTVSIDGIEYTTTEKAPVLTLTNKKVSLGSREIHTLGEAETMLTNFSETLNNTTSSIELEPGSTSIWFAL